MGSKFLQLLKGKARPSLTEQFIFVFAAALLLYRLVGRDFAIGLVIAYSIYLYLHDSDKHSLWRKNGVPGPPPIFLFGHSLEIYRHGLLKCYDKWVKQYGKVVGIYLGTKPQLVLADADILKRILVTDFGHFVDRRCVQRVVGTTHAEVKQPKGIYENMLVFLPSKRWKDVRNTVTPAFTPAKMCLMTPLLLESLDYLEQILTNYSDSKESFDVKRIFLAFTMDVISTVALACKVNAQRFPGNPVEKNVHHAVEVLMAPAKARMGGLFPWTSEKMDLFFKSRFGQSYGGDEFFKETLKKVIQERRAKPSSRPDFLQLCLNASEGKEEDEEDEFVKKVKGGEKIPLNDEEILSQCVLFLVGGHETIGSCLTWTAYTLAHHQDIQDKLRKELADFKGRKEDVTLDNVPYHFPYLDSVVMESLRKYPPTTSFGRVSAEDYQLGHGMTLPAGIAVTVPSYAVHHHPDYYDDAYKFDPDRFSLENKPKRNPLTFLTFGYGPRNCLGQRFGILEVEFALSHILPKFRFVTRPDTESEPPKVYTNEVLLTPYKTLKFGVEKLVQ